MWKSVCHPTDVLWIRAKNFNSARLCLLPLLCCCSYCLWQRVLEKKSLRLQWTFPQNTASLPTVTVHILRLTPIRLTYVCFFSAWLLFWFMLYEMTCQSSFKPSLLGAVRSNRGDIKSGLHCGDNAKSLCEKGSSMQRWKVCGNVILAKKIFTGRCQYFILKPLLANDDPIPLCIPTPRCAAWTVCE